MAGGVRDWMHPSGGFWGNVAGAVGGAAQGLTPRPDMRNSVLPDMRNSVPGMPASQGPASPRYWSGGIGENGPQTPPWQSPLPQQPQGGTTRRGSQILDAQGNVIGHYDDSNQPVYYNRGGQALPPQAQGQPPQGPVASTNMGMAPSYARLGVPGSMQQSLYGSGLLRPAMPSMNNQSGY